MAVSRRFPAAVCVLTVASLFWPAVVRAQPDPDDVPAAEPAPRPAEKAEPGSGDKLALEEQQIADKFKRLEEELLRMAELTAPRDPRRAALLRKAVAQSKDRLIAVQFDTLVELLKKDQLSRAIGNQEDVDRDLRALLELLLSENRAKQLESEKELENLFNALMQKAFKEELVL